VGWAVEPISIHKVSRMRPSLTMTQVRPKRL
jgi:hypothetical protein